MRKLLFILVITTVFPTVSSAQMIAVNTDVAMDAIGAPSLGAEMTITKKSTLNLNALIGKKLFIGNNNKIIAIQPEWRYYISGRPMYHHYVGLTALLADYRLNFDSKNHEGQSIGIGISFGYVFPLTKRLSVSAHSSVGCLFYKQKEHLLTDPYDSQYTNNDGNPVTNATGSLLVPIRAGVSLSYLFK